jgi:histidine ammonia-lyase
MKKAILGTVTVLFLGVGCAGVQQKALPEFGKHLNTVHAGWTQARTAEAALCSEEVKAQVPVAMNYCPEIENGRDVMKAGLNGLKEVYDQANSEAE